MDGMMNSRRERAQFVVVLISSDDNLICTAVHNLIFVQRCHVPLSLFCCVLCFKVSCKMSYLALSSGFGWLVENHWPIFIHLSHFKWAMGRDRNVSVQKKKRCRIPVLHCIPSNKKKKVPIMKKSQ